MVMVSREKSISSQLSQTITSRMSFSYKAQLHLWPSSKLMPDFCSSLYFEAPIFNGMSYQQKQPFHRKENNSRVFFLKKDKLSFENLWMLTKTLYTMICNILGTKEWSYFCKMVQEIENAPHSHIILRAAIFFPTILCLPVKS